MIEIPGLLGIIYRRFEPGEIIIPDLEFPVSPVNGESYHHSK